MQWLIWVGAAITTLGFAGIVVSIIMISAARKVATDDADLKERLTKILPINLGSLFIAVIGLMVVIVGIMLG